MSLARSLAGSMVKPLASFITGAGGGASPLLTDLVAYWNLDETSGNRADSGPNGYTLTDNNTVGSAAGVGSGQTAADFVKANDEYLSNADTSLHFDAGPWAFCGWFQFDISGGPERIAAVDGSTRQIIFDKDGSDRFSVTLFDPFEVVVVTGGLSTGTWYFFEVEWGGAGTPVRASVNGGARAASASRSSITAAPSELFTLSHDDAGRDFDGKLQAVGRWDRLLTAGERTFLYNGGTAARLYSDVEAYTG